MPFKTPKFWYRETGSAAPLIETILSPISTIYQGFHKFNQSIKTPYKPSIPVICVGNGVAGGSGKTPTSIALHRLLNDHFPNIHFLTRGYKGRINSPVIVDLKTHNAADIGDETILLARHGTTVKSACRKDGTKLAQNNKASLIIMDDGLQNNSIHKDIAFTVIDGANGFGNGKTIPSGPLREPLGDIISKTDAFILIGYDKTAIKNDLDDKKPVFTAKIHSKADKNASKGKKIVAFCGLGLPEKFKTTLQTDGFDIVGWHEFSDHYTYTRTDIEKLERDAIKNNAILMTTEKDMSRIDPTWIKSEIDVLPIEVVFDDPKGIHGFIMGFLTP